MRKSVLFLVLSAVAYLVMSFGVTPMIGPGSWLVLNMMQCKDYDQYEVIFDISRKKINRTHDCFTLCMELDREINTTYSVEIEVYKEVDGGFKFLQTIADDCACTFIKKYAEENLVRALTLAGIDPPDCPIRAGPINVVDFVLDYTEMPEDGMYGTYDVTLYLLYEEERMACMRVLVNFADRNDDDDDDDD